MKRRIPIGLGMILSLAILLGACKPTTQAPTTPPATEAIQTEPPALPSDTPVASEPPPGPLVVLIDNDEGPITPANFNTFIGFWMIGWVYDPLFVRSPDLVPIPALATEATPSADGLTWEIQLRDDVRWHDGEPFTSEDVVFSYDFLIAAGRAPNLSAVESVEANGDFAVTIHLKTPAPFFLNEGLAGYYILPEHIWRDQPPVSGELNQFQGQIGTGAYKLADVVPGEFYVFEANPDYYRGPPRVPQIIAKIVKDRTQQFNQLRTGDAAAVLSSVPPALVLELEGDSEIELLHGSDFFNYIFYTNASRPPFDNLDVRLAIAKAIDAERLVNTVLLGQGVVLPLSWYHPDLPWSANIPHEFDAAQAAQLLETAGLVDYDEDGIREFDGQPTDFEILCDTNNPVEVRATELISTMLKEVGLGASPKCLDIDTEVSLIWPNFVAVANPDYDMAIWGWSSGPQFQRGFIRGMVSGDFGVIGWANLTGLSDAELDQLITDYVTNPDPTQTEALSQAVQERFAAVLPWIPLMSPGGNFAYRPEAYDGWVYVKGTGIMTLWSFLSPDAAQ